MKESRMTFGEHLEELRKRILISLLYLVVGVVVAMGFQKELVDIALGPHKRAFSGAQKLRLLKRLDEMLEGIAPLRTMEPQKAQIDDRVLVVGPIRWEALFAADIQSREALEGITTPFRELGGELGLQLDSLTDDERAGLEEIFDRHGERVAAEIVAQFAPREAVESVADIPRLLRRLETEYRDFASKNRGGSLQELISWGDDLDGLIGEFADLNDFLDTRRAEVLAGELTLAEIRDHANETGIGPALLDVHDRLDTILSAMKSAHRAEIMVISYLEQFYTHMKVAIIFGLLFTIPFILFEMWKFVGAGLYIQEQRYVVTFLPFSLALFVVGAYFGYEVLIPVALTFLAGWGDANVNIAFTLGSYITLFFTLTLVLGLVFQTPLVMVFLTKIGAASVASFRKHRRIAIMVGVILAAFLTPPDPFSLVLMAGPMILLYEFGILVCQLLGPRKKTTEVK
jgi:Tat protein translocase TatC